MIRAHILQETSENGACLPIDEARDTLHTAATGEATNRLAWWLAESRGWGEKDARMRTGFDIPRMLSRSVMRWRRLIPALRVGKKKGTIIGGALVCGTTRRTFQDLSRPFRVQTW